VSGKSHDFAANLITIINAASTVGRIATGQIAASLGNINTLSLCTCIASLSVLVLWLPFQSGGTLVACAIVYGLFCGGFIGLVPVVMAELWGVQRIATIIGLLYIANFIGTMIGAPSSGAILDNVGHGIDFKPSIIFSGLVGTDSSSRNSSSGGGCLVMLSALPTPRATFFASESLSLIEKCKLMKLKTSMADDEGLAGDCADADFAQFLATKFKLTGKLLDSVLYAVSRAEIRDELSARAGCVRVRQYVQSIGRYGRMAFLCAMYGGGSEIARSFFCRLCAVSGGTYILSEDVRSN
ncbi:hypothetical protein GGH95_001397, partial [Coemansia sp. RSA 1836]